MKLREILAAIEAGLASGDLRAIDPDEVPKENRPMIVVMNGLIDRINEAARDLRQAELERDAAAGLICDVVQALPMPAALVDADGTVIAATARAPPPSSRMIAVPGTEGVTLILNTKMDRETTAPLPEELHKEMEALTEGLDRLAAGSFMPLSIDGLDDPLGEVKRAFNRAIEAVSGMIAVAPLFGRREP